MKSLFAHPLFILGTVFRLVLVVGIVPHAVSDWYVPFLDFSTSRVTVDPWGGWLGNGGTAAAFPYGYAMWCAFLPFTLAAKLVGIPLRYAYEFTLLAADVSLLLILHRLVPGRQKLLLVAYWLSPIVLLASYGLGFNDLVPVLFFFLSIYLVRLKKPAYAGAAAAAAISAKLSMVIGLPFFAIYLYNNKALRQTLATFLAGFACCAILLAAPLVFSEGALQMLLGNPEMGKIYRLAIDLGGNASIYIAPLVYLIVLYLTWRVKRLNFDLFLATTGMAFLLVVLMTPSSPGWFVWSLPFLALYQVLSGRMAMALIGLFSGLYVLGTLLVTPLRLSNGSAFDLAGELHLAGRLGNHSASLLLTAMVAIGVILAIRMWREAISRNDFFRLSRKPFVIGIAGDSGAGKDTLGDAIAGLFGNHSVVKLSGDDYHLWDRQKPMWQVMTHLNPMSNDLEAFSNDLVALSDGKTIQSRRYDHQTGKMSKPFRIRSNDLIIASGLHALYLPILRECCNLRIYLDIDEGLRRHFKLQRDVRQRGHSVERVLTSFEKREPDSERFIRPQSAHADLVLSLQPIHPRMLDGLDDRHPLRLKLTAKTRHVFNELSLIRVLVGICGLHVDVEVSHDGSEVELTIEGDTSAADIAMAAEMLCPRVIEFLDIEPQWKDGMVGLMQLLTLSHISQALTKRFI